MNGIKNKNDQEPIEIEINMLLLDVCATALLCLFIYVAFKLGELIRSAEEEGDSAKWEACVEMYKQRKALQMANKTRKTQRHPVVGKNKNRLSI